MQFLKPYSTLAVGLVLGYFLVPKLIKMAPIGGGN